MQPLQALHWLPVQASIDYKQSTLPSVTTSSLTHPLPTSQTSSLFTLITVTVDWALKINYLSIYFLTVYTPSRQLCSSADTQTLCTPHTKIKTFGQLSFSYCAPKQWNSPFPISVTFSPPLPSKLRYRLTWATNNTTTTDFKFCLLSSSSPPRLVISVLTRTCLYNNMSVCVCKEFIMLIHVYTGLLTWTCKAWCAHPCRRDNTLYKLPILLLVVVLTSSNITVFRIEFPICLCT